MNVRFAATAVTAAAGALLLTVAPAATAAAPTVTAPAEHVAPDLEAEFPVSVNDAQGTFRGKEITLDLEGTSTLKLEAPTPGNLEGEASGTITVTAQHPELGEITVKSEAKGTVSFNSVVSPYPAKLDLSMTGTMTIEKPGSASERGLAKEPLVLTPKGQPKVIGNLKQFPPTGAVYQLQNPIELVESGSPDETIASIDKFPVSVGSL